MNSTARHILFAGAACMLSAQAPDTNGPKFEVVSIHPHHENDSGGISAQNGLYRNIGTTLKFLIMGAYDLREFQVSGGPGWMQSESYDLVARAEDTSADIRPMLRAMLVERFKLAAHWETHEQPVYELVVAKSGSKMHASAPDEPSTMRMTAGPITTLTARAMSMADFTPWLSSVARHPVTDKTKLDGRYNVELKFTNNDTAVDVPVFFTALTEQLGLKLESRKGPVKILVIDHAERPSEN